MKLHLLSTTVFVAATAVVAIVALTAGDANARGNKPMIERSYTLDRPLHGVEGSATMDYYCSYKRIPQRRCSYKGGRKVCKIVKWELQQTCY